MSGLIKNGPDAALLGIRPIAAAPTARDDRSVRLRREAERLKAALEEKSALVDALGVARDQARQDGFDEGYLAGLAAASDGQRARELLLEQGIASAIEDKQALLANGERLAALLARACLDRMFVDAVDRATLVTDLIGTQFAQLDAASVVAVSVSAHDFDQAGLDRLAARFAPWGALVRASSDLPNGSCKIGLTLGEIDLGLDQQWGVLGALLEDLARGSAQA